MADIDPEEPLLRRLGLVCRGGALALGRPTAGATRGAAPRRRVRIASRHSVGATSSVTGVENMRSPSRSHYVIK
eukprot:COSAG03_NODE_22683_length_288_cov_0.661376_1_plen_74_part_01